MTVVKSGYDRKEHDLYETEEWATEALLRNISVGDQVVWEPSAGNGKISRVLEKNGVAMVWSSDIKQYEYPVDIFDFLNTPTINEEVKKELSSNVVCMDDPNPEIDNTAMGLVRSPQNPDWIITNPPYGKGNRDAVKYAELALKRADNVALLLTAKFDFGKTRQHLFKNNPRFLMKIALLDRIQWFEGGTTGTEDHAWYVWGKRNLNTPVMRWEGK